MRTDMSMVDRLFSLGIFEYHNKIYKFTQAQRDEIYKDCIKQVKRKITAEAFETLEIKIQEYLKDKCINVLDSQRSVEYMNNDPNFHLLIGNWLEATFALPWSREYTDSSVYFELDEVRDEVVIVFSKKLDTIRGEGLSDADVFKSWSFTKFLYKYIHAYIEDGRAGPKPLPLYSAFPVFSMKFNGTGMGDSLYYRFDEYKINLLPNQMS